MNKAKILKGQCLLQFVSWSKICPVPWERSHNFISTYKKMTARLNIPSKRLTAEDQVMKTGLYIERGRHVFFEAGNILNEIKI